MQLVQALASLMSIVQLLRELTQSATSANGAKLNLLLTAIDNVGQSLSQVIGMVQRAAQEGRDELTDEERAHVKRLDDAAREAQVAAIAAASDESGDAEAQKAARQKARGDSFRAAREGASSRQEDSASRRDRA